MESWSGVREIGFTLSSIVAEANNIDADSEQFTQSVAKSESKTHHANKRSNMGPHNSSGIRQPVSVSNRLIHLGHPDHYRILWDRASNYFRYMFTDKEYRHNFK